MKKIILLTAAANTILFSGNAENMLQTHCASCHLLTTPTPQMIPTLKAPPIEAVMFHVKLDKKSKKEMVDFILDYVINPDASKSVCESNKVQQYGVMPSLKGKITKEELLPIIDYLIDNYPTEEFAAMIKEIQRNDKMNALLNSPFLINNESLPHITKLLIKHWDKKALGLSADQKEKLLEIRHRTLGTIGKLKPQIKELENEIIEILVDREELEEIDKKLKEIAALKAEASKIHLHCISDTLQILDEEQVTYLLPLWG